MTDITKLTTIQIIACSFALVFYVIKGIVLTKVNFFTKGKKSILAWIPIANLYLLGELVFNKIVGIILVVGVIVTNNIHFLIGSFEVNISILDEGTQLTLFPIVVIDIIALFVLLIMKYKAIKKNGVNVKIENENIEPEYNRMVTPIQSLPSVDQIMPIQPIASNPQDIINNVVPIVNEESKELTPDQKILGVKSDSENAVPIGGFRDNNKESK